MDAQALNIAISGNVNHMVNSLHAAAKHDLIARLSRWASAPNPASNLNSAQKKRQQGTGLWLLESPIFLNWKCADHSLLWLHGKAGSGKTILSSTVIRSLLDEDRGDKMIAYFFFDFQTHEKQSFQNFLSSTVVQLFSQNAKLSTIVEELYKTCDSGRSRPTIQGMLVALRRIVNTTATSTYVVIDALDECQDRRSLLEGLKDIQSWNQRDLHVFGTSRRETDIEDVLCPLATDIISLEEGVVDKDILTYVRYQLQHEGRLSRWSEKTQEEIETALVDGASGMFKWVECQLDAIQACMKLGLLRKALRTLPRTLDETYARILARIPHEHVEDARRILFCLVCAFCPLSIEEIAETLAVVIEGDTYYDIESRLQDPRDILTICSGLVSTNDFERRIRVSGSRTKLKGLRFSHFSIKEYLMSDRIAAAQFSRFALDERYAHELLAKLCVKYLLWCGQEQLCQDSEEWLVFGQIPHRSAFALYAASFWSYHIQAAQLDHSAPLYDDCLTMLGCPALLRDILLMAAVSLQHEDTETTRFLHGYLYEPIWRGIGADTIDVAIGAIPPLFYVSMLGLDEMVLRLSTSREKANSVGPRLTCLAAAAFFRHTKTVQLLLDRGAEVNAVVQYTGVGCEGYYSPTAISCAAEMGREDIVKMLLAEGADVNICRAQPPKPGWNPTRKFNTPLEAAVSRRGAIQTRIVRILLDGGADVHAGGHAGSVELLYCPINHGDTDLITLLLDAGVDPNEDDRVQTPLVCAISGSKLKCAKLLVQRGANLESIESCLISTLYEMRDSSLFIGAMKTALELKPNLKTEKLLFAAAKYGQAPDVHDENDVAALHAAALTPQDDTQILEILLDANANVNIHGGLFGSALQAAAISGKAKCVRILLKRGASPDHAGGSYGTALQIAKNRLEDLERRAYSCDWSGHLTDYGPNGYYDLNYLASPRKVKPADRVGDDYVPHFDFSHLPDADYQAVIDALQSHGTGAH